MRALIIFLAALSVFALPGCAATSQPENQAYAITLSVDRTQEGKIEIAAQIPTIGGGAGGESPEGGESGGGGSYALSSASGDSFPEALDLLRATVPRAVRLSHLKSVVIGENLAREQGFPGLIEEMVMTYRLYGAAKVVISRGTAKDFLREQKPLIGTRLSADVSAMMEYYEENGYVPLTSLTELYEGARSGRSDPPLSLAASAGGAVEPLPAERMGGALPGALPREGENKNEYLGAALFSAGVMTETLTGLEAQWLQLLRGEIDKAHYMFEGKAMSLRAPLPARVWADARSDPPRIGFSLRLYCVPLLENPSLDALAAQLRGELLSLLKKCQAAGSDPLGFREIALSSFLTDAAYRKSGFQRLYPQAPAEAELSVAAKRS